MMTLINRAILYFVAAAILLVGSMAQAALVSKETAVSEVKRRAFIKAAMRSIPEGGEDKTLSPYFFVMSDDPSVDQMPMKSTRADVDIAGVIADVKVTQVYKNEGKSTLEAIYIFPASTRAAVYAMKMTVGNRVIDAEIKEREQARKEYEKAREEGKTASLLEQQRPNVFQMNVANILPGDVIKVEMKYTELLVPTDNVYEFIYPTVVGPRYSNVKEADAPAGEHWIENPYMHSGEKATYTFGLDLNINTGIPISKLVCPSHKIGAEYAGKTRVHVAVPESKDAGNRDFVVKYSLAGGKIESGLLLYQGKDENFFLMMMEPPTRVQSTQIVPREYVFIIDISGSMHGFPLDVTKKLMRNLFSKLKPTDYFNVLLFAGSNAVLSEKSLPASKENTEKAIAVVEKQQGGGGTELVPALKRAMNLPRREGTSRIVVIATDGYVSVEKDAFKLIRDNLGKANLFSFGIGSSVNRHLIEGMARAGMGEPFVILNKGEAGEKAAKFMKYIESPVLQGIKVKFKGFDAYGVEPGSAPDLFALKPVVVYGKYKGEPQGSIVVTGSMPGKKYERTMAVTPAMQSPQNSALRYLWARERIRDLSDMNTLEKSDARVKEITSLGLKYNLMTEYTSFVAVDKVVRADGKVVKVKQPLPMPEGVSDLAVGQGYAAGMAMKTMALPIIPSEEREDRALVKIGNVAVSKVTVDQGADPLLTADVVKKAIDLKKIRTCYEKAGKITIRIYIDSAGRVSKAETVKNTIGSKSMESCVLKRIKSLVFKKPSTSKQVVVSIVLDFTA